MGSKGEELKSEAISYVNILTGQKRAILIFLCENQTKQINYYMLMSLGNLLSTTAGKELQLRWFDYPISDSCFFPISDSYGNFPNDKWKLCQNFNTLEIKQLEINVMGNYTWHGRILKNCFPKVLM